LVLDESFFSDDFLSPEGFLSPLELDESLLELDESLLELDESLLDEPELESEPDDSADAEDFDFADPARLSVL
jgi:hypothetical protein